MNSFILHSRPWLLAAIAILGVEVLFYAVARPPRIERTNFLQFSFLAQETLQRLFVYHKIDAFTDSRPTIVQAGDSSGFYGIRPWQVERHLPPGHKFINMSCCANLGFQGYYYLLQYMLEHNRTVRYIILHFTAYTMPSSPLWDRDGAQLWADLSLKVFGTDVWREFMSPWRHLQVPTLAARRAITDDVYYAGRRFSSWDGLLLDNSAYRNFLTTYRETGGWTPGNDVRTYVDPSECQLPTPDFFDLRTLSRKTYLQDVLEAYAGLARTYGVTLVVVFQPTACIVGTGAGNARARAIVEAFRKSHPDVEIPFDIIESWPHEHFSVPAHVKDEFSPLISDRLGHALADIIARRERRTDELKR